MANSISWQVVALVVGVLACFTVLAVRGLLPAETITAVITGLVGWLIPSPVKRPTVSQ